MRVAWLLQIVDSPNRHEIHVPEEEKLLWRDPCFMGAHVLDFSHMITTRGGVVNDEDSCGPPTGGSAQC